MRRAFPLFIAFVLLSSAFLFSQEGQYKVVRIVKAGGEGGFDYVYADAVNRNLYIPRSGNPGEITIFNLDTLNPKGIIPNISAHGVAVSPKASHAFASSKPVAMWDAKTLTFIKTIDVSGSPDGILYESYSDTVYVLSHKAPNVTVLNASDGSIAGTIDIGGAPEQAVSDGQGKVFVDIENHDAVAVIDAHTMKMIDTYSLRGQGRTCAGLAMDIANKILFVACREPPVMVVMNAQDGAIIATLPVGRGTDGAIFNPNTLEAFSSNSNGTLTVIKEKSLQDFAAEQSVTTKEFAKTSTLDAGTGHIFLITADFGPLPSTQVKGRNSNRGSMIPDSFSILEVGNQ